MFVGKPARKSAYTSSGANLVSAAICTALAASPTRRASHSRIRKDCEILLLLVLAASHKLLQAADLSGDVCGNARELRIDRPKTVGCDKIQTLGASSCVVGIAEAYFLPVFVDYADFEIALCRFAVVGNRIVPIHVGRNLAELGQGRAEAAHV